MNTKQKIISILNRELVSANKLYFTLAQANRALLDSGEFSQIEIRNQLLKKILEKGEMPNAVKTNSKPRQWRVFQSTMELNKISINKNNMNTIQKIISVIDKELLAENKQYFTLGQANKALLNSGEFTVNEIQNQLLKKILENGEILHATKTNMKPRQWRVFHSSSDVNRMSSIVERKIIKNKEKRIAQQNQILDSQDDSWWDRPNSIDPNFSNRYVTIAVSIALFVIIIFSWPEDSGRAYDRHIQNLTDQKERKLKKQQTEEWFKMMEAHPEAFERK